MSTVDPFSPGSTLLNFRLGERAANSVWQAEDTRSGKRVAVKLLSRQLPKDAARRDTLVREVRQGAALYHSFLVSIQEVALAGDALLLVMEWIDGQSISARVRGRAFDRTEFFRFAYQIVDALKMVHAKNLIHGNIAGDSIMVAPSGQAKLCGLNLGNLMTRQGQPSAYQQKGNDPKAVSYMAPEQISNQPVTAQTDIFSLGLVLYEAATGKAAYQGAGAAEIARKIVDEQPPSPKVINPNIDNAVLGVMGRCLFKDPFRRHKDARALLDEITRADPDVAKFVAELVKGAAAPAAATSEAKTRSSILFLADVANYAELNESDPAAAAKAAARLQQILGEAVYLFDGQVLDPFGPRVIAELPSVDSAIEAARKGEFDFSPAQQASDPLSVRLLLHAGDVEVRDGVVGGAGVAKGLDVLQLLPPLKLHVSEEFLKKGRPAVRLRDSGARGGVKLYSIVAPEPQPAAQPEIDTAAEEAAAAAEEAAAAAAADLASKKRRQRMLLALVGVVIAIAAIAGVLLSRKSKSTGPVAVARKSTSLPPATAATPRKVFVQAFTVEGTDPALADRARTIQLAVTEVLRSFPEIRIADAVGPDVTSFAATVRAGASGPEIVTGTTATPMLDAASGIQSVVQFVSTELHIQPHTSATAEAYNALANAVTSSAANDLPKTEAAIRAATKADPSFLTAQMLAMRFFSAQGRESDAVEAARRVAAVDPTNIDAARTIARASLKSGDLPSAIGGYGSILRQDPNDIEALNVIGRYAYAVNDVAKFNAAVRRLAPSPFAAAIHQPDLVMASGKIDSAIQQYYTVEEKVPNNPALALKIGRIAVLRHSTPIAELELKKLQESDPNYGLHLLKAYVAAQSGSKAEAESELKAALAGSKPGDDYWTSAAEIAVIVGDSKGVMDALKRAVDRKEPTASYILSDPLFSFLKSDADFQQLRDKLLAQQNEIRAALAAVPL
jgi:tetratricopeptide (TPR) repeat protein